MVRELTEALFTYHVRSVARLPTLNEATANTEADLKLHPAAGRYYSRNAPVRADQFEIAAFGLAALLTLLSAGRWLFQWLRARKLRIDRRAVDEDRGEISVEKVAAIKQALISGDYQINPDLIAEKFLEVERALGKV